MGRLRVYHPNRAAATATLLHGAEVDPAPPPKDPLRPWCASGDPPRTRSLPFPPQPLPPLPLPPPLLLLQLALSPGVGPGGAAFVASLPVPFLIPFPKTLPIPFPTPLPFPIPLLSPIPPSLPIPIPFPLPLLSPGASEGWQRRGSYLMDATRPSRRGPSPALSLPPPFASALGLAVVGAAPSMTTMLLRGRSRQLFVDRQSGSEEITTLVWGSVACPTNSE